MKNFCMFYLCNRTLFFVAFKKILLFLTDKQAPEENSQPHKAIYIVSFLSMTLTKTIHLRQNNIKMYKIPKGDIIAQSTHDSQTKKTVQKNCCYLFVGICCFTWINMYNLNDCRYDSEKQKTNNVEDRFFVVSFTTTIRWHSTHCITNQLKFRKEELKNELYVIWNGEKSLWILSAKS